MEVGEGVEEGVRVLGVAGTGGVIFKELENPNRLGLTLGDRLAPEISRQVKTIFELSVLLRHIS